MSWHTLSLLPMALVAAMIIGCGGDPPPLETTLAPIETELTFFRDDRGRYVTFKGINLGGNIKVPVKTGTEYDETPQTYYGHIGDELAAARRGETRAFTYVGRPFSLAKADAYFAQMKALGFNAVRLMWMWEAVYPERKYKPDTAYLEHFEELVRLAGEHGIYVLLNLHENLWSRAFYTHYSEWPVCEQCCRYDEHNRAIDPDGFVHDDIICTKERKAECCPPGEIMNQIWSLFPNRTREELGISGDDSLEERARKYRQGFSDRVSGDGAPMWANRICVPEKNFDSPYWGVNKFLGAAQESTGPLFSDLVATLRIVLNELAKEDAPILPADLNEQLEAQLDRMEPYLPPDAFGSLDTYDGLPFTFWGINNGISLMTNICFGAFFTGDTLFPERRTVEYGDSEALHLGVEIETFYTDAEARERAAVLRAEGYSHVAIHNLRESLQGGFRAAWQEIARIGKRYPHVIGYDILNEPAGVYLLISILQAYLDLGSPALVANLLDAVLVDDDGQPLRVRESWITIGEFVQQVLEENLEFLPRDDSDETRKRLGLLGADLMSAVGLNLHLDKNHLKPLYEYVGQGIAEVYAEGDEPANRLVLWLEPAHSLDQMLGMQGGVGGQWEQYATTPALDLPDGFEERFGEVQFVWAPHWYPDIYPFPGLNQPERILATDEYQFRDYEPAIEKLRDWSTHAFNNVPFVLAEFGTYWNFRYLENEYQCQKALEACRLAPEGFLAAECNIEEAICPPGYMQSRDWDYLVSAQILNNYYEALERMFASSIVWVYTSDNDPKYGDWWDHEDFSLVEFIREEREPERYAAVPGSMPASYIVPVEEPRGYVVPRGHRAYVRPYARALAGKPLSTHYYSDLHNFVPVKGEPDPLHEFEVRYASKETTAPSIIFVPELPYLEGFYVWLSDGYAVWDAPLRRLYHFPQRDDPGAEHWVRIRPPMEGQDDRDWRYFIRDAKVVTGGSR